MAYQSQAKDTFNLVNTTLLDQAQQVYLDIVNETVGKVLAGVQTPQEALREAAERWADKGIPALIDKVGRKWSTEAYINMVTRSMVSKVSNEMQTARFQEYGVDLVEISSHADSRPSHITFQGKIYSISGQSTKYPPLSVTGYGTIEGIGGINCRHVLYPYIEGLSVRRFPKYDESETKKRYAESQKQRYLERRIREAKREKALMEAMGDEEGAKLAAAKVRERQAVMREFIKQTSRTRRYDREQIYTGSHGVNQKELVQKYNRLKYNYFKKQEIQHNIQEAKKELKRQLREGLVSKELNVEKQNRHIIGTDEFDARDKKSKEQGYLGASYLTISIEEIKDLIDNYATKGEPLLTRKGKWNYKELIIVDKIIGYAVGKKGKIATNQFVIHYSKTGAHIVPREGE